MNYEDKWLHSLGLVDFFCQYNFEFWLELQGNELIIILIDVFDKGQWRQGVQNILGNGGVKEL